MSIDIKLLAEDLMVLRHVPYEALETVKTQHVTLHLDALEAREFTSAVDVGPRTYGRRVCGRCKMGAWIRAWRLRDGPGCWRACWKSWWLAKRRLRDENA